MNKLFLAATTAFVFGVGSAQALDLTVETDTYYSVETEVFHGDVTLSTEYQGFGAHVEPKFNLSDWEIEETEVGGSYKVSLGEASIEPYGTAIFDKDFDYLDTNVGVKTSITF